jgi:hypothetical protein
MRHISWTACFLFGSIAGFSATSSQSSNADEQPSAGQEGQTPPLNSVDDNTSGDKSDENAPSVSSKSLYPNCGLGYYYEDGHCYPINKD